MIDILHAQPSALKIDIVIIYHQFHYSNALFALQFIGSKAQVYVAHGQSRAPFSIADTVRCPLRPAYQIAATIVCFPNLKKVYVADLLFPENAEKFVAGIQARLQDELGINASSVAFEATNEPEVTVPQSDIVSTVTPSREPVIKKEWVRPGMHFSTVGSDMEGKEELDPEILGRCEGRTSDTDITIYDPAGMALLDIAAAKVALDLAEEKGLGTVVEL